MAKNKINFALVFIGYVVPLCVMRFYQNAAASYKVQDPMLGIILLTSIILVYRNVKKIKKPASGKWLNWMFIVLGIALGLCSAGMLLLIYSLRNCCSF